MRQRLRKKDRIAQAGKGCNAAQYPYGKTKRKGKEFGGDHKTPEQRRDETGAWAAKHSRINP